MGCKKPWENLWLLKGPHRHIRCSHCPEGFLSICWGFRVRGRACWVLSPEGLIAELRKQFFSFFPLIWSFCSLVFGQKDKQVNEGMHLCVLFRYNLQEHNHVVNAHSIFGVCSLCRSHQNGTSKGVLAISKQSNYLIVLKKSAKCSSWKTKYACNIAVAKSFLERLFENSLWSPKHSVEYRLTGANHLLGIGLGFRTSYNL